jgi:hypothetical protein
MIMTPPNVRFARDITEGIRGKDVIAHKRAISRARPDFYPWHDFTDYAGGRFMDAIINWKMSRGMNTIPKIGRTAHETLERTHKLGSTDWAFDAIAIHLAEQYWDAAHEPTEAQKRAKGVDALFYWYAHRAQIAYTQKRPFELGKPPYVPMGLDCSAYSTNGWFAADLPDPNGRNYDHLGYTGTMMDHGIKVHSVTDLKPLDLIFYGYTTVAKPGFPVGSPTHVASYVGMHDSIHMVLSNGHHPIEFYPYDYRSINHLRHYDVS